MADIRISGPSTYARSESDIRLRYADPNNVIAAANHVIAGYNHFRLAVFYSLDGGAVWSHAAPAYLPLVDADLFQADPNVDWTSDSTAWALCCAFDSSGGNRRLRCYRSPDLGKTWNYEASPSGNHLDADRPVLWVDHGPKSKFKDRLYVTWKHGSAYFFARRTAGANGSWQPGVQLSGAETTSATGGDVKTNRGGDVFVFWHDAQGSRSIFVRKSTDGGAQFGPPVVVATTFSSSPNLTIPAASNLNGRGKVYVVAGAYRTFPHQGSKKTKPRNLVYAVWSDLSGAPGCDSGHGPGTDAASTCKTRVWFSRSTDGGATWSAPVKLNDQDALNDQFHSKLCVDEKTGILVVVYRDTINDPARRKTDVWVQVSSDDGETWGDPVQVNTAPSDETTAGSDMNQYGDYDSLTGFDGTFFPSWTDRRGSGKSAKEEIWTVKLTLPLGINVKKLLGDYVAIDPVAKILGDVLPPERKGPPVPPGGPYKVGARHEKVLKRLSPIQRAYALARLRQIQSVTNDLARRLKQRS